ncbi:MAG: glycerol-3-phosphate 1-O-acyltransferase PlsY [Marinibacterium sp.]|nr:glycerol-3-phosphate 1-O-acyltransferase PlsY [Marinibacterium sp.]
MPQMDSSASMILLALCLGYGLGSVPFGMVLTRIMGLGNLRDIGSGNIGATNVLRTGNKLAAALTLLLDAAKGAVVVVILRGFGADALALQLGALAAMLGHCFPVWLGFRGGKGVATFLGLWLVLAWPVGLACCASWLVGAALTRISSMGALVAAAASVLWVWLLTDGSMLGLSVILALLVITRHHQNIARIRAGTEPRIGSKGGSKGGSKP